MFILFLLINKKGISKKFQLFGHLKFDKENFNSILRISSPLMLQFAVSLISWEFFYILIERNGNGTVDLAISNVMRNVFGFFGCFSWAFAAAANAMVSNVIGQGLQHRVPELINKIMKLSLGFALSVCIIINIIPREFLSIYGQSEAFITEGIPVLRVISTALIIMSISVVWLNSVTGTGNTRITLYTEVFAIVFYCLYVWLVLEKLHLPVTIGWMSEWLYWICLLVPSFIYIKSGRWKNKKI
jgi:Na+-driven multidrug efflux pump